VKRILVTGAGGSAASNFVASLRLAPEPFYVVGVDVSPYHLELADVDARYLVPRVDAPEYFDALNYLIAREGVELVHAQPDPEVALLARERDRIDARTFLPSQRTVEVCQDKARFVNALSAEGLPAPDARTFEDEQTLRRATKEILDVHGRAWLRAIRGAGARAALPVTTPAQAAAWVTYWIDVRGMTHEQFMVSQFLPGREYAFQSLWFEGELVTSAARERLEYLFGSLVPSGQTSTPSVARTVHRDDVNDLCERAIVAIDPSATGIFCVDLKEDADGHPLITEVNCGRFFTTSNFLAAAGANMPHTFVKLAYGEPIESLPRTNAAPADLYWVRMIDMGYKLVPADGWSAR
jgi:PylC-like, N-terminal domain/ATP-grasp in the biosynthetic pathway with Ter operon